LNSLSRRVADLTGWRRALAAVLIGAVTALAQPPMSWPIVLFLAMPVLLWLLDGTAGPRAAFAVGWLAGAGHFAAAMFWIVEPFLVDAEIFGWMAPFALVGLAGGLALFWAVPFALARALWPPGVWRILVLASLWTVSELGRSYVLTGFPWGLTAYAWVETPVIQTVALFGPYMLGLLTLVAALLPGQRSWSAVAVAALLVGAGWGVGAWRLAEPVPVRQERLVVRLVQPDASQALKWQPGMQEEFFRRHLEMSRAEPRPDVVVWSETAVPFLLERSPELLRESAMAAAPGTLILGIQRSESTADGSRWYNSLAVLGSDGTPAAVYDKHHLVPFGEYIPRADWVARLGIPSIETLTRGGFSAGPGPHLISVPEVPPFLPLICYEAIFPRGLQAPEGRPEWLLQVTNDAWFGTVSGPYQHFAQARIRAIEQGLPLARAANTGISAMVDPYGRVVASLGLGETGFVDADLPGCLPSTLYVRLGDLFVFIAIALVLGLTVINFYGGFLQRVRR
jgi:apolipoprotein N-acyltransferase